MSRTILSVVLSLIFATAALASSRVRFDEGARSRQTRLASSAFHTCAVLDDGTVRCWGNNSHGEVGDGTTTTPKKLPVAVSNLTNIVSVTAGATHSCALRADGRVWCWGDNGFGQLGDGTTTSSSAPVLVDLDNNVVAVSAGNAFTCALKADGTVWCWGINTNGQLGMGSTGTRSLSPVQATTSSHALTISAGAFHACALIVGGTVECWGNNAAGQLGNGNYSNNSTPVLVVVGFVNTKRVPLFKVVDISAGTSHTCALLVDGKVSCWGSNDSGELGNNSTAANSNLAVTVVVDTSSTALTNAVAMSAGDGHSCALLANGDVQCWGDNSGGQLGSGTTNTTPRRIAGTSVLGLGDAFEVVTGNSHTCAIEAANWIARCWGQNQFGQLGNGTTNPSTVPNTVSNVSGSIGGRAIHAFGATTCARRGNDSVSCWGEGGSGQLGNAQFQNSSSAVNVSSIQDAISFSGRSEHVCAVHSSGTVTCWGWNASGQLGNGNTTNKASPVAVAGLSNAVQVAAGFTHSCALLADGTVRCWGSNMYGELGNGTFVPSNSPVQVSNLSGVTMISAGHFVTCALIVDGTARCWGNNTSGQLGDGQTENMSSVPVTALGLNITVAISAADGYTCALSATGGGSCWGRNDQGQLGNSTTSQRSVPDAVVGLTTAVALAGGGDHTCAVLAVGSASCWGNNSHGQLAAKDTEDYLTPTPVIQSFSTVQGVTFANKMGLVIAITPGRDHSCALQGNGGPKCWGSNSNGQVGNGTITTEEPRPIVVNSFTANVKPSVLVKSNGRIAEVTALMNCSEGSEAHIYLTLQQGQTTGSGQGNTKCTGGQVEVGLTIPAQGPSGFQSGPATANVEAIVRDKGTITEDQHWTRAVTISIQP